MAKSKRTNKIPKVRTSYSDSRPQDVSKKQTDEFLSNAEQQRGLDTLASKAASGEAPGSVADIPLEEWKDLTKQAAQVQLAVHAAKAVSRSDEDTRAASARLTKEKIVKRLGYDPETGETSLHTPMRGRGESGPEVLPEGAGLPTVSLRTGLRERPRQTRIPIRPHSLRRMASELAPVEGSAPTGGGAVTTGGHYVTTEELADATRAARNPVRWAKARQRMWLDNTDYTTRSTPETTRFGTIPTSILGDPPQSANILNINESDVIRMEKAAQGVAGRTGAEYRTTPDIAERQLRGLGDTGYFDPATSRGLLGSRKKTKVITDKTVAGVTAGESAESGPKKTRKLRVSSSPIRDTTLVGPAFSRSESARRGIRMRRHAGSTDRGMSSQAAAHFANLNIGTNSRIRRTMEELPLGNERRPEGSTGRIMGLNPDYLEGLSSEGEVIRKFLDVDKRFGPQAELEFGREGWEQRGINQAVVRDAAGNVVHAVDVGIGSVMQNPYVEPGKAVKVKLAGSPTAPEGKDKAKYTTVVAAGTRRGTTTKKSKMPPEEMGRSLANKELMRTQSIRESNAQSMARALAGGESVKGSLPPERLMYDASVAALATGTTTGYGQVAHKGIVSAIDSPIAQQRASEDAKRKYAARFPSREREVIPPTAAYSQSGHRFVSESDPRHPSNLPPVSEAQHQRNEEYLKESHAGKTGDALARYNMFTREHLKSPQFSEAAARVGIPVSLPSAAPPRKASSGFAGVHSGYPNID